MRSIGARKRKKIIKPRYIFRNCKQNLKGIRDQFTLQNRSPDARISKMCRNLKFEKSAGKKVKVVGFNFELSSVIHAC